MPSAHDHAPLRILIAGATGLVGQGVVEACLASPQAVAATALVRRAGSAGPRLPERVLPVFSDAQAQAGLLAGFDACFYCAGAAPVGTSESAYRAVTLEATGAVARAFAQQNPQGRFLYISGAYANARSRLMPLRVKGETEQALAKLPIRTVMLRPAGVCPVDGTSPQRAFLKPLYWLARPLMTLAARYAPSMAVRNLDIGVALIALARMPAPPAIVECAQIAALARQHDG